MTSDELRKLCARAADLLRYPSKYRHTQHTELMEELEAAGRADQQEAREDTLAVRNIGLELSCDELKARIAELEQQVLALREVMTWALESSADEIKPEPRAACERALSSSAHVGREAKQRILDAVLMKSESSAPGSAFRTGYAMEDRPMASEYSEFVTELCEDIRNGASESDVMAMLEAAPQPDTVEPVAVVEQSDFQTAAALIGDEPKKIAVRVLYPDALKIGDKLYTHPPATPDTVAVDRGTLERWHRKLSRIGVREVTAETIAVQVRALLDQEPSQ